jgi:adenylosuccinate synthase
LTPVYTELKGWSKDLTGLNQLEQLPAELHGYVEFIEKFVGVPVSVISVGPDRTQTLMRKPVAV